MKRILFILLIVVSLFSCKKQEEVKPESIPEGAIPIKYYGHVYLTLETDSIKGNFVFDTGAHKLYYDSLFYAQSGYKHKRTTNALLPGAGTKKDKVKVVLDTVKIDLKDTVFNATVTPIFNLKPILGDYADGIIGVDFFLNKVMRINYEKEYLSIHSSIKDVDTVGYTKIEMLKDEKIRRLYVPMIIAVKDTIEIKGKFLIDLGAGGSVFLTNETANKYNLNTIVNKKVGYYTEYGGAGGGGRNYSFRTKSVTFGAFQFDDVVMGFSQNKTGALSKREYAGILGNEILSKFDVIFDFDKSVLYVKPNKKYSKVFEFSRLGFSYVDRNKTLGYWLVTGMYENSLAEQGGLKIDDKIIKINGAGISDFDIDTQKTMFRDMHEICLTIQSTDDTIKEIRFALQPVLAE